MEIVSMRDNNEFNYSNRNYGISYEKLKYHSLHHAIYDGRITQVRLLLKLHPELVNFRTDLGLTPLMVACLLPESEKRNSIIRLLIKAPLLNPYYRDRGKRSVIFYFINYLELENLIEFFKFTKFNYYSQTDVDGYSILHYAAVRENLAMLEYLINLFISFNITTEISSNMNFTPLLLACKFSKYRSVALIIKMGGKYFNVRDNEYFRNSVEWLEYQQEKEFPIEGEQLFYFDKFEIEYDIRSGIPIYRREFTEMLPMSARIQNSQSKTSVRQPSSSRVNFLASNSMILPKLEMEDKIEKKSLLIMEIENMPHEDLKEFVIDSLKNKRKMNKSKRVSIIINEKIFFTKRDSITISELPQCRETSASIAHRLLGKAATYYL